jgi:hypothetical protein
MFIQGNLQLVFDALYSLGIINPALKADWAPIAKAMRRNPIRLGEVINKVNLNCRDVQSMVTCLSEYDQETLLFLAMEVAREFVDFEDRKMLH